MDNINHQISDDKSKIKIYLMTAPASGKTFFTNQHPTYKGIKVVDFSAIASQKTRQQARLEVEKAHGSAHGNIVKSIFRKLRRLKRKLSAPINNNNDNQPARLAYTGKSYHEEIISYIRATPGPVVILGRMGLPNPQSYPDISIAAVLIPEAEHIRNCSKRKRQRPNGSWTEFNQVRVLREKLQNYTHLHSIRLYPSFASAIDGILKTDK